MPDEVKDGRTLGWKLWEKADTNNDGGQRRCQEQEWRGGTNGESSCEAPGLDSGSVNTLEMLIVAAVVNWHRQLKKVKYTEPPRWTLQAMGTCFFHILTFLSIF